ncbi:AAA family ATPase [Agrobacterium vitis]
MRLDFIRSHLSITEFPSIEIDKFAIVVGLNGSGKTHLLGAIQNGSIANSLVSEQDRQLQDAINLLQPTSSNFNPGTYASQIRTGPQNGAADGGLLYIQFRDEELKPFKEGLAELYGTSIDAVLDGLDPWSLSPEEIAKRLGREDLRDRISEIYSEAEEYLSEFPDEIVFVRRSMGLDKNTVIRRAQDVSKRTRISMLKLRREHINLFSHWGSASSFNPDLAMIFGRYRDIRLENWIMRLADEANGTAIALSNDDFYRTLGEEPWKQVNRVLQAFGLPYEVCEPPAYEFGQVDVIFRSIKNGHQIKFENLSSGEQVLSRFAISTLNLNVEFLTIQKPKLLLLDEMDASLHPEMVARWLRGIQDGLVSELGIPCIITTHSPTTVALAPENALYEMVDGRSGLRKISKQAALNKLTFGVPTLAIDFSGRRQVFVESDTDAAVLSALYGIIKPSLAEDKNLNFLSTGYRKKPGGEEQNTGCVLVKKVVNELVDYGNTSVFGLIDWDGVNKPERHIRVIAEGRRDGLENLILDPLLICLFLIKHRKAPDGVEDIAQFNKASSLGNTELQRLADAIQIGIGLDIERPKIAVHYVGGAEVQVLDSYLKMPDHDLEEKLKSKYGALNMCGNGRGRLTLGIVEHVLYEYSDFCPLEVKQIFEEIARFQD